MRAPCFSIARRSGPKASGFRRLVGCAVAAGCALVLACNAAAQTTDSATAQRPRIGLVLSGGGARGAAHIGVLKVLEELRIPIDAVAGTSMGALIGSAYASGMAVEEMQRQVLTIRTADILRDDPPRRDQPERLKRDDKTNFLGPEFGVKDGDLSLPKGAVSGIGLEALLRGFVRQPSDPRFDALPIPLRVVTTDIETGRMRVLASGDLAAALRASISIPGLFAPAEIDGRMLVDGGLTRNLPVDVARQMGVDIVIAVNLGTPLLRREQVTSVVGVTAQMINILTEQNVRESLASLGDRDILISPALGDFASSDFDHMADIVGAGAAAASALAPRLATLALSPSRYAALRADQQAPTSTPPVIIDELRIAGLTLVNPAAVRRLVDTQAGRPLDAAMLDADLQRIYGSGDFGHVGYRLLDEAGKRVLVIDAEEKSSGPGYLRFGLGLSNDFSGNAYFQALASYRRTWVNSRGAEWRTDFKLGRVNQLTSELFQPLQAGGMLFVAPSVDVEQRPFDIYDNRTRVARFSRQTGQVALDLGVQSKPLGELRLGLYRGRRTYRLDTGPSSLVSADESIDIGGARLRWSRDQLDSGRFPRDGYAFSLDLLASEPALGARDRYTRWEADYLTAFSSGNDTLQLGLHAGGALGRNDLPAYDLFAFGGLLKMSGYRSGQLLGQSLAFGRIVYARRLATGTLLEGLFGGVSLEAGRVGGPLLPASPTGLLTAGSIFIATDTPIGPVYLGLGHARGGNNAIYLYLGVP